MFRFFLIVQLLNTVTAASIIIPNPAVVAYFKQAGLQKLIDSILPTLIAEIKDLKIPDIEGTKDSIHYKLSKININSAKYTSATITLNDQISLSAKGLSLKVTLDWEYKEKVWPHVPYGGGSADATTHDSSFSISLSSKEHNGKLVLNENSCDVFLKNFDIDIHGSILSWLYDIIISMFKSSLLKSIEHTVEDELKKLVDTTLNRVLASFPWRMKIDDVAQIDYTLTSDPTFLNHMARFGITGAFENISNSTPPNLPHGSDLNNPNTTQKALDLFFDQYVVNSAFLTYYQNDRLQGYVYDKDIPSDFTIRLNTSSFKFLIPALYKKYPNDSMRIFFKFVKSPVVALSPRNESTLNADLIATFFVNRKTSSHPVWIEVFSLSLGGIIGQLEAFFQADRLMGHVGTLMCDLHQKNSTVGPIPVKALNNLMHYLLNTIVLKKINIALGKGILLPNIDGLEFVSPHLMFGIGYLRMTTDVSYTPPAYIFSH